MRALAAEEGCNSGACSCGGLIEADPLNFPKKKAIKILGHPTPEAVLARLGKKVEPNDPNRAGTAASPRAVFAAAPRFAVGCLHTRLGGVCWACWDAEQADEVTGEPAAIAMDGLLEEALEPVLAYLTGRREGGESRGLYYSGRLARYYLEGARSVVAVAALLLTLVLPLAAAAAVPQVNVNTATIEQLAYLPHVGPARAAAIVEARGGAGEQRYFGSVRDFCGRVKGLAGGRCRDLAPYVLVGRGPTTATAPLPVVPTVYAEGRTWYVCPSSDVPGSIARKEKSMKRHRRTLTLSRETLRRIGGGEDKSTPPLPDYMNEGEGLDQTITCYGCTAGSMSCYPSCP
jgi:hypothetical protein